MKSELEKVEEDLKENQHEEDLLFLNDEELQKVNLDVTEKLSARTSSVNHFVLMNTKSIEQTHFEYYNEEIKIEQPKKIENNQNEI